MADPEVTTDTPQDLHLKFTSETETNKIENKMNLTFSLSISSGSLKPLAAIKAQLDLNFIFCISLLPRASTNFLALLFNLNKNKNKKKLIILKKKLKKNTLAL